MKVTKHIILAFFIIVQISFSQSKDVVQITVDKNFDIMRIAEEYLGSKDYWVYIIKFNKLSGIEQIKTGMSISIPIKQVKSTLSAIESAKKTFSEAINIGGKVLAEDLMTSAENYYNSAIKAANNFDFVASYDFAKKSETYSKQAYQKTKEIRDKTVDAIVSYKKGILQKRKFAALSWLPAQLYENLREKDIARTLSQSNAQITFYDLSQIRLNENSQAIIQSSRYDPLTQKSNSKVKLEKGDAYALLQGTPKKKFDIEIPGVNAKINSKYFWVEKGNKDTKLANYNGEIELEAKNQSVVVQKNQGSVIPDGGVPSQPVPLLEAPKLFSPADQNLLKKFSIDFSWSQISGASKYWLELAKDANFKSVISLTKILNKNSIEYNLTESGVYYWHVCSVDNLGLPGPYSETFSFAVANDKSKPFIMLPTSPTNIFTQKNVFEITGKTSTSSKLKINDSSVNIDSVGNFYHSIKLQKGKNIISFIATDFDENSVIVKKNVFFETDEQLTITELETGTEFSSKRIFTNTTNHKFALRTIPFANITYGETNENNFTEISSDSTGIFFISLELKKNFSQFDILVTSQTGIKKKLTFEIILDTQKPEIETISSRRELNSQFYVLRGRTDATKILVNQAIIDINSDNTFEYSTNLIPGENVFEIKAYDEAGNQTTQIEKIIYDNLPPVLTEYKIIPPKKNSSVTVFRFKATDETQLKKLATVNYIFNSQSFVDYAKLNDENGWYELQINKTGVTIISVELEDYFANKKLYELSQ